MQDLKLLCFQSDLVWEKPKDNKAAFEKIILSETEFPDLIILPETFTTGFPVDPTCFSETENGPTIKWMRKMAQHTQAVICGSLLLKKANTYANTLIWMRPDGSYEYYDKRHVFSMGGEHETISPGNKQLIVELKGWKIKPMICYDLRFPVWSKNTLDKEGNYAYDIAVYIGNWPAVRTYPWQQLLKARAIENLAYVVGVNRVGIDGQGNKYSGDSLVMDPKGYVLKRAEKGKEEVFAQTLSYDEIMEFRKQFDAAQDWDEFEIKGI